MASVSLAITILNILISSSFKRISLPELRISKKNFQFEKVKELLKLGIWCMITGTGITLMNNVDLVVTNLCIDTYETDTFPVIR